MKMVLIPSNPELRARGRDIWLNLDLIAKVEISTRDGERPVAYLWYSGNSTNNNSAAITFADMREVNLFTEALRGY